MTPSSPPAPASRRARNPWWVGLSGAGWEYAWTDNWTFRLEYLFTSFPGTTNGTGAITDAAGGSNPFQGSADLVIQTARAGVNFKF